MVSHLVSASPETRRFTGCPCGCLTKLPWFDDPDCIRRRTRLPVEDWPDYGAQGDLLADLDPAVIAAVQAELYAADIAADEQARPWVAAA